MIRGSFDSHARRSGSKKRAVVSAAPPAPGEPRSLIEHADIREPSSPSPIGVPSAPSPSSRPAAPAASSFSACVAGASRSDGTSAGSGVDGGDPASASPGGGNDSAPFFLRSSARRGVRGKSVGGREAWRNSSGRHGSAPMTSMHDWRSAACFFGHSRRIFWSARDTKTCIVRTSRSSASPPLVAMMRRAARNSAREEAIGRKYGSSARVRPEELRG